MSNVKYLQMWVPMCACASPAVCAGQWVDSLAGLAIGGVARETRVDPALHSDQGIDQRLLVTKYETEIE